MQKNKLMIAQAAITTAIFLAFISGIFYFQGYILAYLLIPLILTNIVLLFVNKTKGLPVNILLLVCALMLRIVFIEYLFIILGSALSLYHMTRTVLKIRKKEPNEKKPEKKKED